MLQDVVGGLSAGAFILAQSSPGTITSVDPVKMMIPEQLQQPATVIISPMSAVTPSVLTRYLHRQSIVIGSILIFIGVLSAVFNTVSIVLTVNTLYPLGYNHTLSLACHGLWGGILVRNANIFSFVILLLYRYSPH